MNIQFWFIPILIYSINDYDLLTWFTLKLIYSTNDYGKPNS